jgi:hypothetical protein
MTAIDPSDGITFWHTNEYYATTGISWKHARRQIPIPGWAKAYSNTEASSDAAAATLRTVFNGHSFGDPRVPEERTFRQGITPGAERPAKISEREARVQLQRRGRFCRELSVRILR